MPIKCRKCGTLNASTLESCGSCRTPFDGTEEVVAVSKSSQGGSIQSHQPLMTATARDATIELYERKIKIARRGFGSLIIYGAKGNKEILLKHISAIQLKMPGFTSGYIQFSIMGGNESTGGIWEATEDENTVLFGPREAQDFQRMKDAIEERIANLDTPLPQQHSDLDDLEKLAQLRDKGIITEEEFEAKKKQILRL